MLNFECPSCKTKWQAANEYAGKAVVCPKCQQTATVPPTDAGAFAAPPTVAPLSLPPLTAVTTPDVAEAAQAGKSKWHDDDDRQRDTLSIAKDGGMIGAWLRIGVYVVIGVCVFVLLVALLFPSVGRVREAGARTQSINNLKQLVLAFQSFNDANKRLPFNGTGPAVGGDPTSGSWGFQILPYIDANPFYTKPELARNVAMNCYLCPGRGRVGIEAGPQGGPFTDYFYNNYLNDPKQATKPNAPDMKRAMIDITDGTSNTVFVGHGNIDMRQVASDANVTLSTNILLGGTTGTMRSGNNGESAPGGVTLQRDSVKAPDIGSWGGPFPQGALMGMGDGTVRVFPYSMQKLSSFLTPTGNEVVILPDT